MPPDSGPTFFVDASLGKHIVPEARRQAGATVVIHDNVFEPGTPDHVWLRKAGQNSWIVLTKDRRIRYREIEKKALMEAGVAAFVFSGKDLTGAEMASSIVKALPGMLRLIHKSKRPFIAVVTKSGDVRLVV